MIDSSLDHLTQCKSLVLTGNDQHDLSGIHNRLNTHGECHTWDSIQVIVEESTIVENSLVG